jgi:hypothetical protein
MYIAAIEYYILCVYVCVCGNSLHALPLQFSSEGSFQGQVKYRGTKHRTTGTEKNNYPNKFLLLVLRFTADTSRSTAGNLLNEGDIGIVRGSKFFETLPPEKIEGILSVEFYPTWDSSYFLLRFEALFLVTESECYAHTR